MSLAILFHYLCAQHVSNINISIIRSLRLCCWISTSVVLFSVRCVLVLGGVRFASWSTSCDSTKQCEVEWGEVKCSIGKGAERVFVEKVY